MNLSELRTKLRRTIGNPSQTQVLDDYLDELINDSYTEICDEFRFRSMRPVYTFKTVVGVDRYQLNSQVGVILRVWNETDRCRIKRDDMRNLADVGGRDVDLTGSPRWYYRIQDYMMLVPVPDAVYCVTYYAKVVPSLMEDDDDVPQIPANWHIGIWKLARHHYWDGEGDIPKSQYAYNNYRMWAQRKSDEWADEMANEFEEGGPVPAMIVRPHSNTSTAYFERSE